MKRLRYRENRDRSYRITGRLPEELQLNTSLLVAENFIKTAQDAPQPAGGSFTGTGMRTTQHAVTGPLGKIVCIFKLPLSFVSTVISFNAFIS